MPESVTSYGATRRHAALIDDVAQMLGRPRLAEMYFEANGEDLYWQEYAPSKMEMLFSDIAAAAKK